MSLAAKQEINARTEDCPGPGRCHTSSWCPDCDVATRWCDASSAASRIRAALAAAEADEQRGAA